MLCDIFEATNKFETGSFFDVFFSRAFDHGFGFCKRKRDLYSIRILKVADSSKLNFRGGVGDTIIKEQGQSNWKTDKTSNQFRLFPHAS